MNSKEPIATVYLDKWSKSSDTYRTMKSALDRIAKVLGGKDAESFAWEKLRYETTRGIATKLEDAGLAGRSVNTMLSALRGVLETAWRADRLPSNAYRKIEIHNKPGQYKKVGRALETTELDEIALRLETAEPLDAALIAMLIGTGLRRVEIVKVQKQDYNDVTGRLTAKGKGNKIREVPVAPRWRPFIQKWSNTKTDRDLLFDMSRRQVSYIIERFCEGTKRFTPHDLRKTFATHICRVSDIAVAQRLLGHASINTTSTIYDRRGVEAEDEAVKGL